MRNLLLCSLLLLAGCKSGGLGFVASVQEVVSHSGMGDGTELPNLLVRYDGDTFVAWAQGAAQAEVFITTTQLPVYGPVVVEGGTFIVTKRTTKEHWKGKLGEPLPEAARALLRPSEISSWGVTFELPEPAGLLSKHRIAEEDIKTLHRTDNKGVPIR